MTVLAQRGNDKKGWSITVDEYGLLSFAEWAPVSCPWWKFWKQMETDTDMVTFTHGRFLDMKEIVFVSDTECVRREHLIH